MMHTRYIVSILLLVTITEATESSIVGGQVAKAHSRPYMASLQFQGHHSCGGVLIRKDFVLTAAHCKHLDAGAMTVVLGAHDITKKEKTQQLFQVATYFQHPNFTGGFDYDIMLLKLKTTAKLEKYVKPIGLPKKDGNTPATIKCAVAGWGRTGPKKPTSNVLKETTEKTQFNSECQKIWRKNFNSLRMVCTNFDKKKGGICEGDSGGPLICNTKLQGITAYTAKDECDNPKYPHVFTKVSFYLPWIKTVLQKYGNAT
ncbi:granzyme B(G,H)-like [Nematolebias whitei]|uniref:granzyme B(G,H)-like n=1 Tax=Nematolebias whitei TaxID=451745 RepID=UPI00189B9D0F|nr:granzyme B(G,H)-like [Nematolebias whitei]